MLSFRSALLTAAVAGFVTTPALAQDIPNLVGTWKGSALAVHIGATPYRSADSANVQFGNAQEYTYTITEQRGQRFAGKMTGGRFTETIIGALAPDNRTGMMLDDDGQYRLTLIDPNTIDMCYTHLYPTSKVVACFQAKRQP
jgi:hypothetical protein